jgi:hypothetical protein
MQSFVSAYRSKWAYWLHCRNLNESSFYLKPVIGWLIRVFSVVSPGPKDACKYVTGLAIHALLLNIPDDPCGSRTPLQGEHAS